MRIKGTKKDKIARPVRCRRASENVPICIYGPPEMLRKRAGKLEEPAPETPVPDEPAPFDPRGNVADPLYGPPAGETLADK
ncbi:MAG: hypothetical protein IK104_02600 [Clostridia bacterium]|nr:hypothetical protein [Clostridia bacterium]